MKHIIFALAFLAWACTPEGGDSDGESSNSAGMAAMGNTGGLASTAGVAAPRGGEVAENGAGQASAVAGATDGLSVAGMSSPQAGGPANAPNSDCRNAALACSPGFECRMNDAGRYECLPPAPRAGEPAQPMAGEVVSGGQPAAAGDTVGGMSSAAGEAMIGGQSMAGAPNAGQAASAGMPSQAGVPVSGEMMVVMAGMIANGSEVAAGGEHNAAGQPMAGAPAPEACYGVRPIEVRPGNPMPGAIAAAFEVSTCMNAPAPNLVEADFALFENGEPIDAVEASRTILDRKAAAFVTIVLDNSPSVAAANAVDAVADAALAYVTTALTDTEQVYVSVASFSRRFTVLAPYSNDLEALRAAIETYRADGTGSNTTNLYGSYIEALTASTTAQTDYRSRNRDGLVTFGEVLFLTDGNDNARVNDLAEAQAALSNTTDEVLVVGLGDVDANAVNALSTTDGALAAVDNVRGVFDARVTRILQRQQSIYVLGYCSPILRGDNAVTVAIDGAPGIELLNFNADGWLDYVGPECSRAAFTDGCTDAACGGLWCGGCGSPHHSGECAEDLSCICTVTNFEPNTCATCRNFWSGENCDVCTANFAGMQCDACASNYAGENCSECANFWSGENCDVCEARFNGLACNECSPRYADQATGCQLCSDRAEGPNCATCRHFWTGEECTVCDWRFGGENCDRCADRTAGPNCERCTIGFTGHRCDECYGRWSGPNCDVWPPNFDGPTCANYWSGANCTVCQPTFTGENCDQCTQAYRERDDTQEKATQLPLDGVTRRACANGENDSDWYVFNLKRPQQLTIELLFDDHHGDLEMSLHSDVGRIGLSTSSTDNERIEAQLEPGTYHIRVYTYGGEAHNLYRLFLRTDEFGTERVNTDEAQPIPDAGSPNETGRIIIPFAFPNAPANARIFSMTINNLKISHTFLRDLRVTIQAENETIVTLWDRQGDNNGGDGGIDDDLTDFFDGRDIEFSNRVYTDFWGRPAQEQFTLVIEDFEGGFTGSLDNLDIEIQYYIAPCSNFWTGDNCDVCAENFTGTDCERCASNFSGELCEECANFWSGNNCDVCEENFAGEDCDECAPRRGGPQCSECAHFWQGEDCEVCPINFDGDNCDRCAKRRRFNGIDCNSCANYWSGENCDVCQQNFGGVECNRCADGYGGDQCQIEICGDGILTPSEECDDGSYNGADSCFRCKRVSTLHCQDSPCDTEGTPSVYATSTLKPTKLTATNDAGEGDAFGTSVSISANTAIIGAPYDDERGLDSGAAFIYSHDPETGWQKRARLLGSETAGGDYFGASVSIDGRQAIVGAWGNSGSAYIFRRDDTGVWTQSAKLTGPGGIDNRFGISVFIHGNTAVVGATRTDGGAFNAGSAYVFSRGEDGLWSQSARLVADDPSIGDNFGNSVSVFGNTAIVGASSTDDRGDDSGSVYIFERRPDGTWSQDDKITATDAAAHDKFGESVAIWEDTVVVGAFLDDDYGENSGSMYIFELNGAGQWTQMIKLTANDAGQDERFGRSVAISQDTIIVGAYGDKDRGSYSGSAYAFTRGAYGNWRQTYKFIAEDAAAQDRFGYSVSISGSSAVIAAYWDDNVGQKSGSAYIFHQAPLCTADGLCACREGFVGPLCNAQMGP